MNDNFNQKEEDNFSSENDTVNTEQMQDTYDEAKKQHDEAVAAAKSREERNKSGEYSDMKETYTPDIHELPDYDKPPKLSLGKILKYIVIGLVVLVYALLMMRVYLNNDTGVALNKKLIANDKTVEAYNNALNGGDGEFTVWAQSMGSYTMTLTTDKNGRPDETRRVSHSKYSESKEFRGMIMVSNFLYYEDAHQVVITVRFNRASIEALKEVTKLESVFAEPYLYALTDGKKLYTDYDYVTYKRFTYNYRRIIFNDVDLKDVSQLSLNVYCNYGTGTELSNPLDIIDAYDKNIPMKEKKYKNDTFTAKTNGIVD